MKKMYRIIMSIGIIGLMLGCSSSKNKQIVFVPSLVADSTSTNGIISSTAAIEKSKDTTRKFIRTAEIKFRVKSVLNATYKIEAIISNSDGFVTYTGLNSRIDNKSIFAISPDSSLETIYYTVDNEMVIRVPNAKLDTTLKSIGKLVEYLDYRIIKADDVKLKLLSNRMTQQRVLKNEGRLIKAIDERGKKLNETSTAEENLSRKQEQSDEAKVSNLALTDQINFSTIRLTIYQRQEIKRWLIGNDNNIKVYEPGFGKQLMESINFGWSILREFLLFLIKLWGILVFGIVIYLLIRLYRHKVKK
jgi:hypothetical protein